MEKGDGPVNDRDKRFCEEYLIDLNAQNAALRAGFTLSTARTAAAWIKPERPSKPAVRAEIDRLIAERSRRTGVNADRVVRELARIAFADITDIIDTNTCEVREDATKDDRAAIASMKVKHGEVSEREVKLYDKARALELLGKHLGMFTEMVKIQEVLPVIIDDTGQ